MTGPLGHLGLLAAKNMRVTRTFFYLVTATLVVAANSCARHESDPADSPSAAAGQIDQPKKSAFEALGGIGSAPTSLYSNSEIQQFKSAAESLNERIRIGEIDKPLTPKQLFNELGIDLDRLPRQIPVRAVGGSTTWTTYQLNKQYELEITERFHGGTCIGYACGIQKTIAQ